MNIKQIQNAIRVADLENVKVVPVKMEDLVRLLNHIEKIEGANAALNKSLRLSNDQYNLLLAQALSTPPLKQLDEYV